jgi:hypothetical protein
MEKRSLAEPPEIASGRHNTMDECVYLLLIDAQRCFHSVSPALQATCG